VSSALHLSSPLHATTIPRVSFEELTDASETIAAGRVTDSWTAWDPEHKYIWTHYRLSVTDTAKGARVSSVEFAEPGGAVAEATMLIPGAVRYTVGEEVVVFLARMPNGYLRTTGWAQGKYSTDSRGLMHGEGSAGAETIDVRQAPRGTSLRTLEGIGFGELKRRVAFRRAQ
jgi:hypothetical protein